MIASKALLVNVQQFISSKIILCLIVNIFFFIFNIKGYREIGL